MKRDYQVTDIHNHFAGRGALLGDTSIKEHDLENAFDRDLATRILVLDERGVDEVVILGAHRYLRPRGLEDTRVLNDDLAKYRDRSGGRIVAAVGIVEPTYGRHGSNEIDRCHDELGFIGISFHSRFQGVPVNDPTIFEYLTRMQQLGMIPFLHAVGESPDEALWRVDALAGQFPELSCIVLDPFSTFDQSDQVLYMAEQRSNLIFETGVAHGADPILRMIAAVGAERVIYGSDFYGTETTKRLYHVLSDLLLSNLSDRDKRQVLHENAKRLIMTPKAS